MAINTAQRTTSVVFIDGSLADLQAILSGLDPSVTAIVLDPAQDGIRQMADALAGMNGQMPFTSSRMAAAVKSTSAQPNLRKTPLPNIKPNSPP